MGLPHIHHNIHQNFKNMRFCSIMHEVEKQNRKFIDPEGVVIKTIALQEIGTPSVRLSVRPRRIGFQTRNAIGLNLVFYESP